MDEITRRRCEKCDFMNNDVPISKKKPNCRGLENITNCEIYMRTNRLEDRIRYLRGEISGTFICSRKHGCEIDFYEE
jgi:hypothetical protein